MFTREDIKNASGDVLMEADTLIELKTTDENGQITFTADLPGRRKLLCEKNCMPRMVL